jgi:hypothetical protein
MGLYATNGPNRHAPQAATCGVNCGHALLTTIIVVLLMH